MSELKSIKFRRAAFGRRRSKENFLGQSGRIPDGFYLEARFIEGEKRWN
jgi:hypothetical protein